MSSTLLSESFSIGVTSIHFQYIGTFLCLSIRLSFLPATSDFSFYPIFPFSKFPISNFFSLNITVPAHPDSKPSCHNLNVMPLTISIQFIKAYRVSLSRH